MPAEWEPHRATWISWPHHEPDWPGKLGPIPWVYAEIARVLAAHEPVEILCASDDVHADPPRRRSRAHAVRPDRVRLHVVPTDRGWLRDSAPTGVLDAARRRRPRCRGPSTAGRSTTTTQDDQQRRPRHRRHHRPAARGAAPRRHRRPHRARRRRHRGQRPRPAARHRGVAAQRRPGPQPRPRPCRLRGDLRDSGSASPRRSGSAKAASATTPTATSTTSPGSSADDVVVLAVEEDPADDNHARSMDNLRRLELARPAAGRCGSSRCRFRGR